MSLKPFALIAPDACVVTCGYRLHSEIISRSHLLIRQFVPTANGQFYLLCIAMEKGCEARHDVYSSDGTKFITRTHKATSGLFFFKAEVLWKQNSKATISVLKLNTHNLWHQHLGHANSRVIKALPAHVIGGPATGAATPYRFV